MTITELITEAYDKITVDPTSAEITAALPKLNTIINSLSVHEEFQFADVEKNFTLIGAQANYTIGTSGADFTSTRPIRIHAAYILDSGNNKYLIDAVGKVKYREWAYPTSGRPTELYYSPTYPNGSIKFNLASGNSSDTLYLITDDPFATFAAVEDTFNFPPEYEMIFIYTLALELGVDAHTDVVTYLKGRIKDEMEKITDVNGVEHGSIIYDSFLTTIKHLNFRRV